MAESRRLEAIMNRSMSLVAALELASKQPELPTFIVRISWYSSYSVRIPYVYSGYVLNVGA